MIADPSLSVTGLNAEDLQKIIERFEQMPWLEEVLLFGSRAKGSAHEGSDIDLAIKGRGLTLVHYHELAEALEQLWLPYKFDIVIYDTIDEPALIEHIRRVGIRLYSK